MDWVIICTVAFLVSMLTLFSGFGLGTIRMPAFALFFPVPVSVAATAVVHLVNNIFKVRLMGRQADTDTVLRFALPAVVAAMLGAALLGLFAEVPPLWSYELAGRTHQVTALKVVIGVIIVGFAIFELLPGSDKLAFDRKYLPLGGLLSGFFGGLSGSQGALRSAFLIKAGLSKEAFIGTGAVSTAMVDVARLLVYGLSFYALRLIEVQEIGGLVAAATLAAFLGAFIGKRMIKKVTLRTVQVIVGVMLILVGLGMITGLL